MIATPSCRFCRTPLPPPILDLGLQPLSNAYLTSQELAAGREHTFPLRMRVCESCNLVQIDDSVPPELIFDAEYAYFSSYSDSWLAHCKQFAEASIARFSLGPSSRVLEVASNDGYLLQFFAKVGVPVLGIEPTANTAAVARAKNIPTEVRFFNEEAGLDLAARGLTADLVHGANVLAHVPDIADFVAGFRHVLKPHGTLTLEFPHLLCMIERVQFDTIYHEHFSYLSLKVVDVILRRAGLRAYDVEGYETHGGSIRLFCCHLQSLHEESRALVDLRNAEREAGLDRTYVYKEFSNRAMQVRRNFINFLLEAKMHGQKIAAYGAAAKGNTFLNFCGATTDDIVCVFDKNTHKQGKLLPGSHIPILDPSEISNLRPDLLLILPWNLKSEIMEQMTQLRGWGGKFVIATPEIEIVA